MTWDYFIYFAIASVLCWMGFLVFHRLHVDIIGASSFANDGGDTPVV